MKFRVWWGCLLMAVIAGGCGGGGNVAEKIAQIRVWEDQSWTANGRLVSMLADRDETVRERAAYALGRVDDTLTLDTLREVLLTDKSPKVRAAAAFALGVWTWKVGKNALVEALPKETDPDVLIAILQAAARVYAREEYAVFFPYLHHSDPRVRAQTAQTLDMLNRREATDSIIPLLDDPEPSVRKTALLSLIRIGVEQAARQGARFVNDPDPEIRALAYKLAGSARFPERNALLIAGFRDPEPQVRCAVADACIVMRDTGVLNPILQMLPSEPRVDVIQRVLRAAAEHIHAHLGEWVLPLLSHPDPTVRAQAVNALCNRRDTPCWAEIARAETDPDWRVRVAIFDAIAKTARFVPVDTQIIFPMARRLMEDPSPRVRAKALQTYIDYGGGDGDRYLARLYHDSSDYVVAMAVQLIGTYHINLYTDSLHQLYQKYASDPNPDVKWAILAASANMLPTVQIDSIRQDIINWGMADPNRLVRWYTIAVAFKFRQDRRHELGVFETDLTVANVDSLLPEYASPPLARIETTRGAITVELDTRWAPRAVRQFMENARMGAYDNTPINELQGGQLVTLGDRYGDEANLPPADVRDEYSPQRVEPGTLMWSIIARHAGRGTFMIALNRLPYQDWRYPVFGRVREGLDVARNLTLADTVRTIQILPAGAS
jgi:HEAT repeat protein/cyclophilin family peptidyl-prolyl cis-trans isomerase